MTETANQLKADTSPPVEDTVRQHSDLFYDFLNNVRGKETCNLSEYAYSEGDAPGDELDGIAAFEEVAQMPNYPGNRELSFLKSKLDEVVTHLPDTMSILEIGPGSVYMDRDGHEKLAVGAQKTDAFIDAIRAAEVDEKKAKGPKVKTITQHVALDVALLSANNGSSFIAENYGINSKPLVADYRELAERIKKNTGERPLALTDKTTPVIFCFGNTPFNLKKVPGNRIGSEMANTMADLGEIGGPGSIVVLTHFCDLDKAVYETDANKRAIMAIWHRIARDPAVKNMNPEYWEPKVEIDEDDRAVVMSVQSSLRDHFYKIYLNGMAKAEIMDDTRFDLARSVRPEISQVQKSAEFAGFETLYNNADDENSEFGIHVLRYNP